MAPAMTLNGHAMHPKYSRTPLKSSRPLTGPCPAILAAAAEVGTRPVHDEPAAREAAMAPAGPEDDPAAATEAANEAAGASAFGPTEPIGDEARPSSCCRDSAGTSVEDKAALTGPALRSITTKLGTCKFPKSGSGIQRGTARSCCRSCQGIWRTQWVSFGCLRADIKHPRISRKPQVACFPKKSGVTGKGDAPPLAKHSGSWQSSSGA
ncbi:TPA: hypothetical protein ACH3X1_004248 [Trebouxia sp. C0004]